VTEAGFSMVLLCRKTTLRQLI